ncbi:MAG TPA: SDR family oxidoreductase [Pirellulales bacterium]|jgi:3-oxoacyl-[acyl-carrier protein] reductase|nr:SDR family oxidoreductase [Pirellulales bacterium]
MEHSTRAVAVISGGSRGLGQALVADFLERGYAVATFSRGPTPFIEGLLHERSKAGAFFWEELDGVDVERVKQFVLGVARRHGRIDVLVNNAAIGADGLFTLMRPDEIHRAIAVNLEGAVGLIHGCARVMLAQGRGSIVSISSVNALRGHAGVALYSATKAALDGLTRSLARELGPQGIRVNSVAPGYFESEMVRSLSDERRQRIVRRTPLGRLATPNDVVAAVRFLTSTEAEFVTGQTLVVDGGLTC